MKYLITILIPIMLSMQPSTLYAQDTAKHQHFDNGETMISISYVDYTNLINDLADAIDEINDATFINDADNHKKNACLDKLYLMRKTLYGSMRNIWKNEPKKPKNHGKVE